MSEDIANTETALSLEEAEQHISEVANLTSRALQIVGGAPYFKYVSDAAFAYLCLDGDEATLVWPEDESDGYGGSGIETHQIAFPSRLLFLSHEDFLAWKAEARREYDTRAKRDREAQTAAREAQERATYEALKRKYETRP